MRALGRRGSNPGRSVGHNVIIREVQRIDTMRYVIYHIADSFCKKILFARGWSGAPSMVVSAFNDRYYGMCGRYYDSTKGHVCL